MNILRSWSGAAALVLVLGTGCSDEGAPLDAGNLPMQVNDYESAVQSIWDRSCGPACHGASGNGGLDLRAGQSYGNLVGVVSATYGAPRIVAGDPTESVLFDKITDTGRYGGSMPAAGPALAASDIAMIRAWIVAGAPNGAFDPPASPSRSQSASPRPE